MHGVVLDITSSLC